jgi:glycosyltransferase involved in cell wall biosynthesis
MTVPKISIIIPVYNAAPYIEQCIDSILNQTLQDIEIIAVNDGSTDESKQLLDRLALTDERLNVFHQSNKGVSATRNFGLQQAAGKYIGFADADDFMAPTMLLELYQVVEQNNCDFGICNVLLLKENEPPKLRLNLSDEVIEISGKRSEFIREMMRFRYDNANWNKLFVAAIIRKHQLHFDQEMHIYEDILFNLQYAQFATKVAIVAEPLYNYRVLQNSLYSSNISSRVEQFNQLFSKYLQFAQEHAGNSEREVFRLEMARATYNQFLYNTEIQVRSNSSSVYKVIKNYRQELLKFNPALFYYPAAQIKGIQGFKKRLLQSRQFVFFACITALKPWFRRPYKFIKGLLQA